MKKHGIIKYNNTNAKYIVTNVQLDQDAKTIAQRCADLGESAPYKTYQIFDGWKFIPTGFVHVYRFKFDVSTSKIASDKKLQNYLRHKFSDAGSIIYKYAIKPAGIVCYGNDDMIYEKILYESSMFTWVVQKHRHGQDRIGFSNPDQYSTLEYSHWCKCYTQDWRDVSYTPHDGVVIISMESV